MVRGDPRRGHHGSPRRAAGAGAGVPPGGAAATGVTTILLVDDEAPLRRALRTSLRARGFDVVEAASGEEALVVVADGTVDLVVLDLGLPHLSGIEVLTRLRRFSEVPVVVLTVDDRQQDKISALDAGADDYVTKPFDTEELLARIRAALRRSPEATPSAVVVRAGGIVIDLVKRRVLRDGAPIHLTRTELALLELLATNPGKLLTHDLLLRKVWGAQFASESHYVRIYVAQLRRKLSDDPANPRLILTEPGLGYRWIGEP